MTSKISEEEKSLNFVKFVLGNITYHTLLSDQNQMKLKLFVNVYRQCLQLFVNVTVEDKEIIFSGEKKQRRMTGPDFVQMLL